MSMMTQSPLNVTGEPLNQYYPQQYNPYNQMNPYPQNQFGMGQGQYPQNQFGMGQGQYPQQQMMGTPNMNMQFGYNPNVQPQFQPTPMQVTIQIPTLQMEQHQVSEQHDVQPHGFKGDRA